TAHALSVFHSAACWGSDVLGMAAPAHPGCATDLQPHRTHRYQIHRSLITGSLDETAIPPGGTVPVGPKRSTRPGQSSSSAAALVRTWSPIRPQGMRDRSPN